MTLSLDKCRSYATEIRLIEALALRGFDRFPHIIARTRDGKWTAIFYHVAQQEALQGDVTLFARQGFLTL